MSLTPVTDHVERGTSLLIEQYRGRPRIESLLRSYLLQVQELSDATWDVMVSRLIDDATGEQLTVLSRLVGENVRLGDDEAQRVLVRARIAVNRSNGHGDDILRVATLLLGDKPWSYAETYPASILIETFEAERAESVATLLRLALAGGVGFGYHYSEEPAGDLLILDADDGLADDDGDNGGVLMGAF